MLVATAMLEDANKRDWWKSRRLYPERLTRLLEYTRAFPAEPGRSTPRTLKFVFKNCGESGRSQLEQLFSLLLFI